MNFEQNIGKNIREIRLKQNLSQESLAEVCGFSNTTLSAYENSRKIPGLTTLACIAKNLNVSIERLYYGDESESFITAEVDEGRKIVNAIYYLWSMNVIGPENYYYEHFDSEKGSLDGSWYGQYLSLKNYTEQIKRLIRSLEEYEEKKETFPNQNQYLEMILSSVAKEIDSVKERQGGSAIKKSPFF